MPRLTGRKLLLTRDADDATDWVNTLTDEGAQTTVLPCIHTVPADDPALGARLASAIATADWLIFTSRRGVDALTDLIPTLSRSRSRSPAIRFAAVGEATAARIREALARVSPAGRQVRRQDPVDCIGPGTAAALGRDLATRQDIQNGARCVLVLAANASDTLAQTLAGAGARVERFDVYRTLPAAPRTPKLALSTLGCDTIIFASPTSVTGFANQVNVDKSGQMVTIGPSTSAAVRERRWEVSAEAREPSLSGIIESLLEANHA